MSSVAEAIKGPSLFLRPRSQSKPMCCQIDPPSTKKRHSLGTSEVVAVMVSVDMVNTSCLVGWLVESSEISSYSIKHLVRSSDKGGHE